MPARPAISFFFVFLLLAALVTATYGAGSSKESTPKKTERPRFPLGPSLRGRYDINVFLSNEKVIPYQFEINELRGSAGRRSNWVVQLSFALEFGSGSGVAECQGDEMKLRETIRAVLLDHHGRQLLTTAGKLRLKQDIIGIVNASLKSARVRQIYFTEFAVAPAR